MVINKKKSSFMSLFEVWVKFKYILSVSIFCLPPPQNRNLPKSNQISPCSILRFSGVNRITWIMDDSICYSFFLYRQQNQNYIPYYGPGTEKELRTENFARFYLEKYLHRKGFLEWIMYCLCQKPDCSVRKVLLLGWAQEQK